QRGEKERPAAVVRGGDVVAHGFRSTNRAYRLATSARQAAKLGVFKLPCGRPIETSTPVRTFAHLAASVRRVPRRSRARAAA
ncbi:MAG TPA: hypothetical protein VGP93_09255, partial [Polyangiaceae bacterium]|nr:hypothetical protein [Polyangiaceae bacterium]